jgi:release factor glutamine methyltransferase
MMSEAIAAALLSARRVLVAADINGSALDSRLLMQAATGLTHEELVAGPDNVLSLESAEKFAEFLKRRLAHEPVSRILGARDFYGRTFEVTPDVLDPRADSETLIDWVLENKRITSGRLLDIGTGSGILAITLLAEIPHYSGLAVDVSEAALHIARRNALLIGVSSRLKFHLGSWFNGITEKFDLIVSNPPYIARGVIATLEPDVKNFDPHLALDGGEDGLFAYRAIAEGALARLNEGGLVVVEIGAGQETDVAQIFAFHGFKLQGQAQDLGGHIRVLAFDYPRQK